MKKTKLLLPILSLVLVACGTANNPTSSSVSTANPTTSSSSETPTTSSVSTTTTTSQVTTSSSSSVALKEDLKFFDLHADMETLSVKFEKPTNYKEFEAFVVDEAGNVTKLDKELIREYDEYYRVDALGLKKGKYKLRVEPLEMVAISSYPFQETEYIDVVSKVREGFAFENGTVGAYNLDGTLKSNAEVIYVDNSNKDTISKTFDTTYTGIVGILDAYKKNKTSKPLCIRVLGELEDPSGISDDLGGDIVIENKNNSSLPITIEGVGEDAILNGFGIRIKNANNIEISNLGFMLTDSNEGDNVSLQQNNNYIWVHDCDLFYGLPGSDADQVKGDGAMDCKKSNYVTFSFNHFFETGKSNLLGNSKNGEENGLNITYHHNWYDHSDSRHPRVRCYNAHVYNNYYDGIAKYGIGSTNGSSIFSENNYFRNSNKPMLISMQGNGGTTFSKEDGGMIKSFGNEFVGNNTMIPYSSSDKIDFDFYDAKTRDEIVPNTVKSKQGENIYNNFDTSDSMYEYNVESPSDAKGSVIKYAGRVNGGDIKFTFTSADDTSYDINSALMNLLKNYDSKLVSKLNESNSNVPDEDDPNKDDPIINNPPVVNSYYKHVFSTLVDPNGVFVSVGEKYSALSVSGGVTYDGVTYNKGVKIQSSTRIEFNLDSKRTVNILLCSRKDNGVGTIKIDDVEYDILGTKEYDPYLLTIELEAGVHTISRGDGESGIYYIEIME